LIVLFVPSLAALTRAERKSADLKWSAGGVVTVCGPGGRLACAVVATSGSVAARPAGLIAGEAVVRADVEEIQENSEEG
jgi:hypothetical protein